MQEKQPFAGFYVAMSVFRPYEEALPHVSGRRFVLDQSPDDEVTPFRFAQHARDELIDHHAVVWLRRYEGGHGWQDDPVTRLRDGLRWVLTDEPAPPMPEPGPIDRHLLRNGGFEFGTESWVVHDTSRTPDGRADR